MDGVGSSDCRILVIGATNRPFDLDEACLRRLSKRIYIGLPDYEARYGMIKKLMEKVSNDMGKYDIKEVTNLTEGFSSSDLNALCKEAAMEPVREIPSGKLIKITGDS